jgi:beta-galactosidase
VWAELLKTTPPEAEVLLRYGRSNGWLDDQPAIVTRKYGRGRITYIGGVLSEGLVTDAAQWMARSSGVTPALGPVPDGIEVSRRVGPRGAVYVLINFGSEKKSVELPRSMQSLMEHRETKQVELPQYGVAVLTEAKTN